MNKLTKAPSLDDLSLTPEARRVLTDYLKRLEKQAGQLSEEDEQELIRDIKEHLYNALETRLKKTNSKNDKLDAQVVLEVLGDLGEPGDYLEATQTEEGVKGLLPPRRLRRAREGRMIAGVCMGLANYFRIDVVLVRLLFVLLNFAGGIPIVAYLAIWLVVPDGDSLVDASSKPGDDNTRTSAVLRIFARAALYFAIFLLVVCVYVPVIITLFAAMAIGFGISIIWFAIPEGFWFASNLSLFGYLTPIVGMSLALISLFLLLAFINLIVRLHYRHYVLRGRTLRWLGLASLASFFLLVGASVYAGVANIASEEIIETNSHEIGDDLLIELSDNAFVNDVSIRGSEETDEILVREVKKARGFSKRDARQNAGRIESDITFEEGKIILSSNLADHRTTHFEHVSYEIVLPFDINIEISNPVGQTEIRDMYSDKIRVENKVGTIRLADSAAGQTYLENKVGEIKIEDYDDSLLAAPIVEIALNADEKEIEDGEGEVSDRIATLSDEEADEDEGLLGDESKSGEEIATSRKETSLTIISNTGGIEMEDVAVDNAEIKSHLGTIEIESCEFAGKVTSDIGSVNIVSHRGELAVSSNIGSIQVRLKEARDDEFYSLESEMGSIELDLPIGLNPYFDLDADLGSVDNNYVDKHSSGFINEQIRLFASEQYDPSGPQPTIYMRTNLGSIEID